MEIIADLFEWHILPFLEDWGDMCIAGAALIVSIIALRKSSKAQKLQNRINELELQIKQYEVDKIEQTKAEAERSCVEARAISLGQSKYRLKVWNSGNATAFNVSARFADDPKIILFDNGKQPYEELDPAKGYELTLFVGGASDVKFRIVTEWEDAQGTRHEKTQMCSI